MSVFWLWIMSHVFHDCGNPIKQWHSRRDMQTVTHTKSHLTIIVVSTWVSSSTLTLVLKWETQGARRSDLWHIFSAFNIWNAVNGLVWDKGFTAPDKVPTLTLTDFLMQVAQKKKCTCWLISPLPNWMAGMT